MVEQLLRRRPLLLILLKAVVQELLALIAYAFRVLRRLPLRGYDVHDGFGVLPMLNPRRLACQHLNDAAADAPDVCRLPMAYFLDDFRRHPIGGADDGLREGFLYYFAVLVEVLDDLFGGAKVRKLNHSHVVY